MSEDKNTIIIHGREYVATDSLKNAEPSTVDGLDYAIVRSREQGVMCGYVESIKGRTVTLRQARQVWRYDSTFLLPDIAEKGVRDASGCQFSTAMSQPMVMLEACGVITCTKTGADSLRAVPDTVK
tara:strand:+ start:2225 stop:2602 length:378 start_codon:yes stop_codon:yes gene_type:complete